MSLLNFTGFVFIEEKKKIIKKKEEKKNKKKNAKKEKGIKVITIPKRNKF